MPKTQIVHIHGGNTFDSREQYYSYIKKQEFSLIQESETGWRNWIQQELIGTCEVILPSMPASDDADYVAWKIWFEKMFPYLGDNKIILIGHSLWTIFLAKYLSENIFPKPIYSLHLVGSVFDGEDITDEWMANFILQPELLSKIPHITQNIHLYHSVDDPICPWKNVEKYQTYFPDAQLHRFENRGHFLDMTFPELLEQLKKEI